MCPAPAIPGYAIRHRLAAGRRGAVWAGQRTRDGRPVALKLVAEGDAAAFRRRIVAFAGVRHPHVVRCLATGLTGGRPWLAMELAAGDLAVEVRAGPADVASVLEAGRDAAAGLAALHRCGLVHGTIAPSALLRMPDGRVVLGAGSGAGDPAADIQALGSVLGSLAAGPAADADDLPPGLAAIIHAATSGRYADAGLLAADCSAVLAGGDPVHAASARTRRRHLASIGLAVLAGMALGAVPAWLMLHQDPPGPAGEVALSEDR